MVSRVLFPLVVLGALALGPVPVVAQDLPPGGTFVDDDGSIFEPAIEAIAAEGITRGCNPPQRDRFCPEEPVTRGQMAALITRTLDLTHRSPGDRFVDDDTSIFEGDIERLAAAGITKGCNPPANDRFCPGDPVTRGQMAAMMVRAYRYPAPDPGDRFVDDSTSIFEGDIERLAAAGVTKGCNPPGNDRFCPGDPVTRGQMAAFIQRAEGLRPLPPPPAATPTLRTVATGLDSPIHVTAPEGDRRLFIVEKGGTIRILTPSGLLDRPFLDLGDRVIDAGERGLLSLAFHPDYADNGRFFVAYSDPEPPPGCTGSGCHTGIVAEHRVSTDPDVARPDGTVILEIPQPFANHNGGHLEFGPDGNLYIGLGDGGSGNDPGDRAQDTGDLLGSILRIDVDGPPVPYTVPADNPFVGGPGEDEIWVYGLRNPWRFAFDGDRIYIGDVGQAASEEIDVLTVPDDGGANLGWRTFEGDRCTGNDPSCPRGGRVFPVLTYPHSQGCSITGGRVYRGAELPRLTGHYLYGDLCSGWIRSLRLVDSKVTDRTDWTSELGTVPSIVSFGENGEGELYVVSLKGTIHRLEAR